MQVRSSYAALDVLEYIKELELAVEALSKEYKSITNQIQVPTVHFFILVSLFTIKVCVKLASYMERAAKMFQWNLLHLFWSLQEVRVKKVEKGFLIQVSCKRGKHVLVTLLQAFEEMGINILQAEVSSDKCFTMEVFGQPQGENLDAVSIQEAVLKALQNLMLEGNRSDWSSKREDEIFFFIRM